MLGSSLGVLASRFWNRPLSVGATFAGLDHLVLMGALIAAWATKLRPPRWRPVLIATSAAAAGQLLYLLCLALATELAASLPAAPPQPPADLYVPPDWFWGDAVRALLPWNLPALAALWHLAVVAAMLRLGRYRQDEPVAPGRHEPRSFHWQAWAPVAVAAVLPAVSLLSIGKSDLKEKTVLAYDQGNLDWSVPTHDRYGADSSGQLGMLPALVASLGGRLHKTSQLTPQELAGADVLLVFSPNQPWPEEVITRIDDYVRSGGSLLVAAGPHFQDSTSASSYNELLEPLGIPVRFDMAISQTEAWRHSLQISSHPATLGLGDDRDRFGISAAASIDLPWQAAPLLVGRWGWSDPGSDFFLTERTSWDSGERLGDLVLAAERRLGAGRVVVLGDNVCLTNQGNVRAYRFTCRLLACLARRAGSPQAWWRQLAALVLSIGLVVLWARSGQAEMLALSLLALLVFSSLATKLNCRAWEVFPDGTLAAPCNLAYIDASHLEAYSESSWSPNGVDGLALTLMRQGYLVLAADDLSPRRLQKAAVLVCIAPGRDFSLSVRQHIRQFVEDGGTLIAMAASDRGRKANQILEPFGFHLPAVYHRAGSSQADAHPLGCLARPYPDGLPSLAPVRFHAAWTVSMNRSGSTPKTTTAAAGVTQPALRPVVSTEPGAEGGTQPIIAFSTLGKGLAIVIADAAFALNKTLENQQGNSLFGDRINAQFWRWMIGQLPGRQPWTPPPYPWTTGPSGEPTSQTRGQEAQP